MRVALCSSEMASLAKVGGLADVTDSLPKALKAMGKDVRVFLPLYKQIREKKGQELRDTGVEISAWMDGERRVAKIWEIQVQGVPVYLVDYPPYFHREHPYGTPEGDYPDNPYRFAYFSKSVLEAIAALNLEVDVIHCNDWETALVPVYLQHSYREGFEGVGTLLTIHNLAYQGVFPKETLPRIGLDWSLFHMEALEYYGNINFLKGGIIFSQVVNTVSPTYAKEIQTERFGYGLDGVLRKKGDRLFGVLNGIDYEEWDPASDPRIYFHYDRGNLEDKYRNKEALRKEKGLRHGDGPLAGMVGRLVEQKGVDLVHAVVGDLVSMGIQLIILGSGEKRYHDMLMELNDKYGDMVSVNIGYSDTLAARIYAGCDLFLMPSRYEPCGLGQMIALRYGTIPVVRATGGLADTVAEYNPDTKEGNGFLFHAFKPGEFLGAIQRAQDVYRRREEWLALVERAMACDFSWGASARRYLELYRLAKNLAPEG